MENAIMKQGQSSTHFTHCNCGEYCTKFCVCVAYDKFCGESCPCKDCWNTPRNIVEVLRRRIETQNMIHQSLERKCAEFAVEIASSNEDNKKTESDALVSEDSSDDNNNTASLFESPTKRAKTSASSIGVLVQCGCDCKENHCLGFWCTCFRTKEFCSKKCTCRECCNNEKHKEKVMISRAIKQEEICSSSGVQCACDCKENHCLGFWCTCFRTKEFCSKKCTCRECCNNEKHKEKVMLSRAIKQEEICSCKTGLCTTDLCYCHAYKRGCREDCECEGCSNIYGSKPK